MNIDFMKSLWVELDSLDILKSFLEFLGSFFKNIKDFIPKNRKIF